MPREHATGLSGPRGEGVATVEALRGEVWAGKLLQKVLWRRGIPGAVYDAVLGNGASVDGVFNTLYDLHTELDSPKSCSFSLGTSSSLRLEISVWIASHKRFLRQS